MKPSRLSHLSRFAFIAGLIISTTISVIAQTREIRLRSGIITTSPTTKAAIQAKVVSSTTNVSGLFLVQLNAHLTPTTRLELQTLGMTLLKYVPDDAFIVRLKNVSPDAIRALSFVQWVGAYQADYKIAPRLSGLAQNALLNHPNATTNITVLISPDATAVEITSIEAAFSTIQRQSHLHLGMIVQGSLNLNRLSALAQASSVLWIEPAPKRKLVDEAAAKIVGGDDGQVATPTLTQQAGFNGTGVTVCVADTGLDTGNTNTMHPDLRGRVTGFKFYGDITDGSDGYGHGTHCAGIVAGNAATGETDPDTGQWYGLGVASGANLFIERIFNDNAGEANPFPSDETLTTDAVRAGAQIGANSWGNDVQGEYDIDAAAFDELVRDGDTSTPGDQPYILEFSAGNAGPGSETMDSPASGKNVIATGASENTPGTLAEEYGLYADDADTMSDFSSRGPCQDGRIKPDLVAPGTWIASAASSFAPDEASIAWSPIDDYYVYMGGTSMAGPHAAGAAAVFVQYYKSLRTNAIPSPALVKAALINSADPLDDNNGGPGSIPNNDEGWGRITLTNIITTNFATAPRYYQYLDQTVLLTSGQVYEQHALVRTSGEPLKIIMDYTDVAGFPGAIPALVNDLDLEVVGPDGTLYRGNQFSGGESVPNAPSPDNLNNVEGVILANPLPGNYLVRVRARNVVEDARLDTAAIDQDFALVVSGDLARPNGGIVLLDRTSYTAPSVINVSVFDAARAASNSINVLLKSTTEPAGEIFSLNAAGNYGFFTNAIPTVVGAAAANGKLEIHNGDSIEADYIDSSSTLRTATAIADLISPTLSNVTVTTDLGVITITWQTSEPANSIVFYGTNTLNLNRSITNTDLVISHSIKIGGLVAGRTYYFSVSSSDSAGNTVVGNNSGAFYSFIAVATPTVLMVDDYDSAGEDAAGSTVIPDSVYTNALTAAGFSYGFWKVTDRGSPQLADLQPYSIVIWRTTDDIVNYGVDEDGLPIASATNNTLNAQQQSAIQNYLNGGGSFFMASMSILQQIGNVPFRQNVLQVGGFLSNPEPPSPCSCDEDFGVPIFFGAPNNSITGGMYVTLDYDNYPGFSIDDEDSYGPDFSDTFTPTTNSTAICFESVSGKPCGVSYPRIGQDSPGRVVFLSFPLDTIPANGTAPNNEVTLLLNALNFLAPGANGAGSIFLNQTVYTVPDQITVEVGDSDLAGTGHATATFTSTLSTNQVTITLNETTHPGLFRGYLTLVAANATTNQLVVGNGNTITAKYFDVSRGSNVVATATVDNVPPVISQIAATTGVGSATVSWRTSKPSDSLVQYGESTISSYTAYDANLTTNHVMSLTGLQANRNYFYQVTSRDAAGNTTVDDNNGAFYTFTTVRAPQPPWFDNLENGVGDWLVVPDPVNGSEMNWMLGTPNNGLETSAYSGTNAWGSNLKGQSNWTLASSFLYSPIIDLTGLQSATLTFQDMYDFSRVDPFLGIPFEIGQLGISTNSSTPPADIPTIVDFTGLSSDGWEKESVDLTPYVGKTIQVVWFYQGGNVGLPLYGWLVDDIGITGVAGISGGTITISKNLGQGTFSLSGPITQSGNLPSAIFTNIPPGLYAVTFGDVSFYQTPTNQTGTLTAGGTLNFTGNYTFIDANHNGISDAWENYYFGSAGTNRTQLTDSDGDGMSDYAEFIAGTNPTNATSKFIFLSTAVQTNQLVQLKWAAIPGRLYQLSRSTNLINWTPLTGWQQAAASPMIYSGTNATIGAQYFRTQVQP